MPEGRPRPDLWESDDCALWRAALDSYRAAIDSLENPKLANLDRWFSDDLPVAIAARERPCIYLDELEGIAAWKMHRGVWRERNRLLIKSNLPEQVVTLSAQAFAAVPDPRTPVKLLASLAGVGPATASAALAAYDPATYPFFDEAVAASVSGLGPVAFTLPYYLKYADALRARARRLDEACPSQGWSAHSVSQALWAAATLPGH